MQPKKQNSININTNWYDYTGRSEWITSVSGSSYSSYSYDENYVPLLHVLGKTAETILLETWVSTIEPYMEYMI